MPDDKRPRPMIDMSAERASQPGAPRPGLPGGRPAQGAAQRRGGGFFGYLFAGLIGGIAVAGGGYFALKQGVTGFTLADPQARQKIVGLEARLVSLETALNSQGRAAPASAFQPNQGPENSNEARSRLDAIVQVTRGLDQTVQALSQKVQGLEQNPGGGESRETVRAEIAAQTAAIQQRLASVERELDALTRAQTERLADARTASLTLALTNLKRAVSDGRPFPAELAAVETLSGGKLPVSQLAPFKETGLTTLAVLQIEFADASKKTIEAHYAAKSSGFMGDMLSRAKSVVQIKPADSNGDSVEAILGRMNTALKAGDLKTTLQQGGALEHAPQEMMEWFARARARSTAEEALRKTDQELLASLTKPAVSRR
jgi:hypothetical protein